MPRKVVLKKRAWSAGKRTFKKAAAPVLGYKRRSHSVGRRGHHRRHHHGHRMSSTLLKVIRYEKAKLTFMLGVEFTPPTGDGA